MIFVVFKGPRSVRDDERFTGLSQQLVTAYLVENVRNVDDIINNNTALKQINELKQLEEDKQNKKRALINYAKRALKSADYLR